MRRNKNKLIKNILTYSVVSTTLLGNTISAFAYSNSVDSVKETQTASSDEASSCDVYAQLAATFTVTIPKKITLSGTDKTGSYSVDVEGDIGGTDIINVVPDTSVALKSTNLANVTASIIQDKTKWSYSEILPSSKATGSGSIYADGTNNSGEISAGSWNGTFNFNISLKENSSLITVEAKNESGEDLNASASEITGTQKDTLLDKLVDSGLVKSVDEIDALIEVESDEFDGIAETTFNVSSIANEGDKVAILHFNEETNEWEYVSTETVNSEGKITADFSSYSPVAFVKVNEDGSLGEHEHIYANTITKEATCTEKGVRTFTCYCGDSYTENITATGHNYSNHICTKCNAQEAGLYNASGTFLCSWEESGINVKTNYINSTYNTSTTSPYYVITNNYPTTTKIVLPDNVTSIGLYAFRSCTSLTSITIPDSVTSIGTYAFYNCTSLTSITIPSSVTSIGWYVFHQCRNLTSINVDENNTNYCSVNGILFNKQKTTLICYPANKIGTSYTIPSSVTSIENNAFVWCKNLTSITIPNSVTSIGFGVFQTCTGLTSITIPSSVTSIGSHAFYGCSNLTNVTFKNTSSWYVGDSEGEKTTALSSSNLSNTSTAATYLKSTYCGKYWTR